MMRTLLYRRQRYGGLEHRTDKRRKQAVRAGEAAHATRSVITRKPPGLEASVVLIGILQNGDSTYIPIFAESWL